MVLCPSVRHNDGAMSAIITVDNRVRLPLEGLSADVLKRMRETCEHTNPEYSKRRAMGYSTYDVPQFIKTWVNTEEGLTLPSGAMQRVREVLRAAGVPFRVVDARSEGSPVVRALVYQGFELRPYQVDMVDKAYAKERCVVRAATGSGKTTAAFALAAKIGLNTLVILPNAKLLKQWMKLVPRDLGLRGNQIGLIRGSVKRLRPLTLATQQTLWSRGISEDMNDFFGAIIVDEGHHAAARTFMQTIDSFRARYRIAFTADERRKDKKEFIVYDLVGGVAHEVTREQAEAADAVVDVEVRIVPTHFECPAYASGAVDFNGLLDAMIVDGPRNDNAITLARRELERGEQCIVLTHRREHARALERGFIALGISSGCMLGEQEPGDEEEFERACAGLLDGSVRVACGTYQALGEGIDLPAVSIGIATTPIGKNKQLFNQVRGRLCRPSLATGKTQGTLYYLYDPRVYDEEIIRNIVAWNRSVKVLHRGAWVDGREYLKGIRAKSRRNGQRRAS